MSLHHPQGMFITFAAVAYRLLALWSQYKLDRNDAGHFNNQGEKEFISRTLTALAGERDAVATRLAASAHVAIKCSTEITGGSSGRPPITPKCSVFVDGVNKATFVEFPIEHPKSDAEAKLESTPFDSRRAAFVAPVNDFLGMAVMTYGDMVRRVGGTFMSPLKDVSIPAAVKPIDLTHRTEKLIHMPGASVWLPASGS